MAILIKHQRFPEFCYDDCPCMGIHWCNLLHQITTPVLGTHERLDGCPLMNVPPHGDLIDRTVLYEQTVKWETSALAEVRHFNKIPYDEMNEKNLKDWGKWLTILTERSAFKFDVADAPTVIPAE